MAQISKQPKHQAKLRDIVRNLEVDLEKTEKLQKKEIKLFIAAQISAQLCTVYHEQSKDKAFLTVTEAEKRILKIIHDIREQNGLLPNDPLLDCSKIKTYLVIDRDIVRGCKVHPVLGDHNERHTAGSGPQLMADFTVSGMFELSYRALINYRTKELSTALQTNKSPNKSINTNKDIQHLFISNFLKFIYKASYSTAKSVLSVLGADSGRWLEDLYPRELNHADFCFTYIHGTMEPATYTFASQVSGYEQISGNLF